MPRLSDSSLAEVRGFAASCFRKLSASSFDRTHVGFGMPEKMSSSTSTRADIDSLPPLIAPAGVLPVGTGVPIGLRVAVHANASTHARKSDTRMRAPIDILNRLG